MSDQELLLAMQQLIAPLQAEIKSLKEESAVALERSKEYTRDIIKEEFHSLRGEIIDDFNVVLENVVEGRINLIAEDVQLIRDRQLPSYNIDALDDRVSTLETVVKVHSQDINELKKAQ